jgi:salicylate hydroxylase
VRRTTQHASRLNQKIFHLPDGPEQRARDAAMRAAMAAELEGKPIQAQGNPNQWADREKNRNSSTMMRMLRSSGGG